MRRVLAALLVIALAVAVAGCGDKGAKQSNAYVDSVNSAQGAFADQLDRLSRNFTAASTPEQDQRTLGSFKAAVDQAVRRLKAQTELRTAITQTGDRINSTIQQINQKLRS